MRLSNRALGIGESQTLAITARAKEMLSSGVDVISFAAGEPDFNTPELIREAAKEALDAGYTRYTAAAGLPELKRALAENLNSQLELELTSSQVVVSVGAKHALHLAFQTILEPGDEVLIPAPYWVSFPEQVRLSGGIPIVVPTSAAGRFEPRPEDLERLSTKRTKAIVINTPNNPTGAVYSQDCLEAISRLAKKQDWWIVSDETYSELVYGEARHVSAASISPPALERTIIVGSFSKTYAMTGWRVGYLAGPLDVCAAAGRIMSHTTSNVSTFSQKAAVVALAHRRSSVEEMRREFEFRRGLLFEGLEKIAGLSCVWPQGAFYVFPDISAYLGRKVNGALIGGSLELSRYLLETALVAVVPGAAFGVEGHVRISYATGRQRLIDGVSRLARALSALA